MVCVWRRISENSGDYSAMSAVAAVRRFSRKCDLVNFLFAKHYDSLGITEVNCEILVLSGIRRGSCFEVVNIINLFRLSQLCTSVKLFNIDVVKYRNNFGNFM